MFPMSNPIVAFVASYLTAPTAILIIVCIAIGYILNSAVRFVRETNHIRKRWPEVEPLLPRIKALLDSIERQIFGGTPLMQDKSPISLSEKGREVFEKINSPSLIEKYRKHLPAIKADVTAYAIQEACLDFATNDLIALLDENDRRKIETVAYSEAASVNLILRSAVGIPLRDAILKERNIAISGADKRNPKPDK